MTHDAFATRPRARQACRKSPELYAAALLDGPAPVELRDEEGSSTTSTDKGNGKRKKTDAQRVTALENVLSQKEKQVSDDELELTDLDRMIREQALAEPDDAPDRADYDLFDYFDKRPRTYGVFTDVWAGLGCDTITREGCDRPPWPRHYLRQLRSPSPPMSRMGERDFDDAIEFFHEHGFRPSRD